MPGAKDATGGPEGGAIVLRGGRGTLSVGVPAAVDADGRNLAVDARVEDDTVVYTVDHRDGDIHYPILLDPYVAEDQRYWFLNGAVDFNGWQFASNAPGMFGALADYNSAFGRGLYIYTAIGINYPSGAKASWSFTAPTVPGYEAEGARIIKADYGYTGHYQALNAGSCLTEGIYRPTLTSYEPGAIWRGAQATDSYTAYNPAYGMYNCNAEGVPGSPATYAYRVHCLSVCGDNDGGNETLGTPGNAVVLGMLQGAGYQARGGIVFMGSSLIFETEQSPPRVTASPPPSGWTDQPFTINATSTDYGLGVSNLTATAGDQTLASAQQGWPCTGAGVSRPEGGTPGSANVGDRNHGCTAPLSTSIASSDLPEGAADVTISSQDILANGTSIATTPKIDRTPPAITPSGTLNDARNNFVGPNHDYTLNVTATDGDLSSTSAQRSGVTSLTATVDGDVMADGAASAACARPEGSCALAINATLTTEQIQALDDTVAHTVEIKATDALNHTETVNFTFRVDTISPSMFSDGDLLKVSGSPLTEDTYRLDVEARDNAPIIPEVDDDGTEPLMVDLPGAGVKDIVVRLDGQAVNTTAVACFDDPGCESARRWTWDLTGLSNGIHTITITAADKVDNQDVDTIEVDVQRQPNQPARTNTSLRRTILGAGASDRAGSSVAAVGDTNGDGHSDYLVGAPGVTAPNRSSAGAVYLVLGTADPSTLELANPGTSAVKLLGPGAGQYCGTAVAAAGDVNGDGLNDVLIGCPGLDSRVGALTATGRVYVIFGRTDPQNVDLAVIGTAGFVITGPPDTYNVGLPALTSRSAGFGERLQSPSPDQMSKDVNGDGLDDIVIGDSNVPQGGNGYAGAVYVIYGKTDGATVNATALGSAGYTIRGAIANGLAGYSTTITNDLDGDTLPDVLVGAPGSTASIGGRAYVVRGSSAGGDVDLASPGDRAITLTSGQANDRFGVSVAALGDTDLDTVADVAIGTSSGVYVLRKLPSSSRAITADDGYRVTGPTNNPGPLSTYNPGLVSTSVPEAPIAPAGDLDGDERADIIIGYPDAAGARAYTVRSPDASRSISVTALPGQWGAALNSGTQNERSGAAVAASTYLGQEPTVTENAQAIIGQPVNSGRVYVISEPTPDGPGVEPGPDPEDVGAAQSNAARSAQPDTPNGPIPGVYRANASAETLYVTVRNDAQSFVIGSAHDGDILLADQRKFGPGKGESVDGRQRYYLHGLFGEAVHRCGWIIQKQTSYFSLQSPAPFFGRTCSGRPRRLPPYRFSSLMNSDGKGDGTFVRLRWIRSNANATESQLRDKLPTEIPLYRNVRPGTNEMALTPDGTLPTTTVEDGQVVRTPVRWRYITKSQKFVMVRVDKNRFPQVGNNGWVFISRAWLPMAFGPGRLCDDGGGTGSKTPKQKDWAPVCSHKSGGYTVPDHE